MHFNSLPDSIVPHVVSSSTNISKKNIIYIVLNILVVTRFYGAQSSWVGRSKLKRNLTVTCLQTKKYFSKFLLGLTVDLVHEASVQ